MSKFSKWNVRLINVYEFHITYNFSPTYVRLFIINTYLIMLNAIKSNMLLKKEKVFGLNGTYSIYLIRNRVVGFGIGKSKECKSLINREHLILFALDPISFVSFIGRIICTYAGLLQQ